MFCPNCRAEYRPGFTRCSDCGVDLVREAPTVPLQSESPDFAPRGHFLAWFLPMASFYIFWLLGGLVPSITKNLVFLCFVIVSILAQNIGCIWMLFQSIRYEKRMTYYVLLSFVPFLFVWYYLERYLKRTETGRIPFAVR
jgi:hypothetical protein